MYRILLTVILSFIFVISVQTKEQTPSKERLVKVEQGVMYRDGKPLRVGIVLFPSPYMQQEKSGLSGPMIDVVHEVLKHTKYNYTYIIDKRAQLIEGMQDGKIDVVFGVHKEYDVHPHLLYTMPYTELDVLEDEYDELSSKYITACSTMENYDFVRRLNHKLLKYNSGYYLGYVQKQWYGITMYFDKYMKLHNLMNLVLVTCVILAGFLVVVLVRVSYLSYQSRQKSHYLHEILNKFPVPVYILDEHIEYTYVNDAAKTEQFAVREECEEAILKQHKNRLKTACNKASHSNATVSFVDSRIPESPYTVYVSPCTYQRQARAIKTVVNTKELFVQKEMAERNSKLKDEFLANISHEVRTPLNSILGFCQLLPEMSEDEVADALGIIETKSKQLHKLINDILLLSKFESSEVNVNPREVFNFEWLPTVVERVHEELDAPATVPVHYVHHNCSTRTSIDTELSYIVMSNLLQNAIKFTKTGAVHVGCGCIPNYLVFYVHDTGNGMTEEECRHIFNRFVKLDTFTQGTGLGLPIVQRIVEILNGHLGLYSVPGKGTTCYFCYPAFFEQEDIQPDEAAYMAHLHEAMWIGKPLENIT